MVSATSSGRPTRPQRDRGDAAGELVGVELAEHVGLGQARRDAVDAHRGCERLGEAARQRDHAGLGGGIVDLARPRAQGRDRAHADDAAEAAASISSLTARIATKGPSRLIRRVSRQISRVSSSCDIALVVPALATRSPTGRGRARFLDRGPEGRLVADIGLDQRAAPAALLDQALVSRAAPSSLR